MDYTQLSNQGLAASVYPAPSSCCSDEFTTFDYITTSVHLPEYLLDFVAILTDEQQKRVWSVMTNELHGYPAKWKEQYIAVIWTYSVQFAEVYTTPMSDEEFNFVINKNIETATDRMNELIAELNEEEDSSDGSVDGEKLQVALNHYVNSSRKRRRYQKWCDYRESVRISLAYGSIRSIDPEPLRVVVGFPEVPSDEAVVAVITLRIFNKVRRYARFGLILAARADARKHKWWISKHRPRRVHCQSGKPSRIERDVYQAVKAAQKARAEAKKVPKREREAEIKGRRDKRSPVIEPQGLGVIGNVAIGVISPLMAGLFVKASRVLGKSEKLADEATSFVDKLKELAKKLKENLGNILWSLPLTLTVLWLCKNIWGDQPILIKLVLGGLTAILGPALWDRVSKFFPGGGPESIDAQSFGVGGFTKVIIASMTFGFFGNKVFGVNTNDLMRRMASADRSASGFGMFTAWVGDAIESVVNFLRGMFGKDAVKFRVDAYADVNAWSKAVDSAVLKANVKEMQPTPETLDGWVKLYEKGSILKLSHYDDLPMRAAIGRYMTLVNDLIVPFRGTLNARNNYRVEPLMLLLGGRPGIGKTCIMLPMAGAILKLSGLLPMDCPSNEVQAQLWQKGNGDFWNGYASQLALIMDDFGQNRPDVTDKENDYSSIIKMVGNWACPLNFADVESKGRIYFNTPLILATTNLESITSAAGVCIFTPDAVVRRVSTPYQLYLQPEYQTPSGFLDIEKFDAERIRCKANEGVHRFPWYMWIVRKHNYDTGTTSITSRPLLDLVLEMAITLKQRVARQRTSQVDMNDFFDGIKPEIQPQAGSKRSASDSEGDGDPPDDLQFEALPLVRRARTDGPSLEWQSRPRNVPTKEDKDFFDAGVKERKNWFLSCLERFEQWKIKHNIGFFKGFAIGYVVTLGLQMVKAMLKSLFSVVFKKKEQKAQVKVQSNRPLTKVRVRTTPRVKIQAGNGTVANNLYANTYKMTISLPSGLTYGLGQILFVCDTLAVIPEHYLSISIPELLKDHGADKDTVIKFTHVDTESFTFYSTIGEFMSRRRIQNAPGDIAFVDMKTKRAHKNVVGAFMTDNHLRYVGGRELRMDLYNSDRNRGASHLTFFFEGQIQCNVQYSNRNLSRGVCYPSQTVQGDCGAPVCLCDASSFVGQTLVGLHIAGDGATVGYCSMISREMLDAAMKELGTTKDNFVEDLAAQGLGLIDVRNQHLDEIGSFLSIGRISKPVVICLKSSLYRTDVFGALGEYNYEPARMKRYWDDDGELRYPLLNAVAPYASPVLNYDTKLIRQATHVAMQKFDYATRNFPREILTFEEAVLGIPCAKFRSIPRGTSAGYPLVTELKNGKKEVFGYDDKYDLTTERAVKLKSDVHGMIDAAKRNERLAHIFMDFMKDELRPAHKVKAGATRLISASPLRYTVGFRMYFGSFTSAAMQKNIETGMAPGMCTYTDAARVLNFLQSKGKSVFAGDFKGFDASQQVEVFDEILDFINRWYNDGEENARIRRVLWLELCHSRHIGGLGDDQSFIYQWNKSLPSGHPFTTVCNSMYSLILLVACYIRITGDGSDFWSKVNAVTYGDDNAVNPSDNVKKVFNQVTVSEAMMEEFGLVYTSDRKDAALVEYTDIEGISFLKRTFQFEDSHVHMALDLESFLYTSYWCSNKKLEKRIRFDVLDNALQELSIREPSAWDAYAKKIYDLAKQCQKPESVFSAPFERKDYQQVILSRSDSWF